MSGDDNRGHGGDRLSPKQAAALIGVNDRTLARWRNLKIGPSYIMRNKQIIYRRADIDEWERRSRVECGD